MLDIEILKIFYVIGILDEAFTEDNHMLNLQLKIVRGKVVEHYRETISFLYTPEGKNSLNARNRSAMKMILS